MSQVKGVLLGFFALIGVVVLAVLVYDYSLRPDSPCETIFEQTSMQFDLKLKTVETDGSVVLGRQQVQELSENAQETALNLKTCCIVLESGAVNPDQFLQCQNSGREYEAKLDDVLRQISSAQAARQDGNEAALEVLRQSLAATVTEAKAISEDLRTSVGTIAASSGGSQSIPSIDAAIDDASPAATGETTSSTVERQIAYEVGAFDLASAITTTASGLPTLVVSPVTRFSEPAISEVLIVAEGTNLRSFRPVQRAREFEIPMVVEPGVYDMIFDVAGQSMIRLVTGLAIEPGQKVTVDPNAYIGFVVVNPWSVEGLPPLERVFALPAKTRTTGSFSIRFRTQQAGAPLVVEPGTYDVYVEPVDGQHVLVAAGLSVGVGEGKLVNAGDKVAAIVYEDPGIDGLTLGSIYVVASGTNIRGPHSIVQRADRFGQPLLVAAGSSYDIVLKPSGGSAVKVQQGITPEPGSVLRFG